jgi:hypothetical protein
MDMCSLDCANRAFGSLLALTNPRSLSQTPEHPAFELASWLAYLPITGGIVDSTR